MAEGEGYPLDAVLHTISEGMSASEGLATYRAAGGEVRTQTWYRMIGETQRHLSDKIEEASRPLNRFPAGEEITRWTTVNASGYMQRVEVAVRDRSTGEVTFKPWSRSGDTIVTRNAAIRDALSTYVEGEGDYDEQVLGAFYVGTHELVPGE